MILTLYSYNDYNIFGANSTHVVWGWMTKIIWSLSDQSEHVIHASLCFSKYYYWLCHDYDNNFDNIQYDNNSNL